ncbi:MAG: hypothetical protein P9M07_04730 [Candidatus Aceula meridiana]|nr:hypothetical protein [Candidatus Aceula meridiana]
MKTLGILLVFFLLVTSCFALEWKDLHNKADLIDLATAQEELAQNPNSIDHLYVLGLVYLNFYEIQNSKAVFEKVLELDPKSIEGRWGIAEILRREHKTDEAAGMLEKIIKENSSYSPALITLAYIRYIQKDFDGSIRLTGQVINQRRENVDEANFLRAHGLYAAAKGMIAHYGGPISKAINGAGVLKHLNIIQKLAPDSPVVNFGLGSYYMLVSVALGQNFDKAQGYLEKAIAADPLFANPYVRLAQIYKKKGDMKKYEELINKAFELDPGNELAIDINSGECFFICLE